MLGRPCVAYADAMRSIDLRLLPRRTGALSVFLGFVLAAAAAEVSGWPADLPKGPTMYTIDGFLDQLPEGRPAMDEIEISSRGTTRTLYVVEYGSPGETSLDMHLSRNMSRRYGLMGSPEEIGRLIDAPAGSAIRGTFIAYTSGAPALKIGKLELPAEIDRADDPAD